MAKNGTIELTMMYGERVDVGLDCSVHPQTGEVIPSMTRGEFQEECDVNAIMQRYENTPGGWPFAPPVENYVDFTAVPNNLQEAMSMMMAADEAFMRLPAKVRGEFDNDPLRFAEYAADARNLPRLREYGLAEPEKVPDPPMRVEVVNPAPPPEKAS